MSIRTIRSLSASLIPLALCIAAGRAGAQEVQVPVDEGEKIERIDGEMERTLGLFPTYENFEEAKLYQLPDSTFALEIFYGGSGKRLKQRTPMSAADAGAFRHRVSEAIAAKLPEVTLDQEGRTLLISGSIIYGLGFYGWAVPVALEMDNEKAAVASYMVTASASFFVPYLLTRNSRVTAASGGLGAGAGHLGIAHGYYLNLLLHGSNATFEGGLGYAMGMSVGEMIGGYYLADQTGMTAGKASMIYFGGLFGTAYGAGAAYLADLYGPGDERATGAFGLLGSGLGYIGGNALANMQHYTPGDAQVVAGAGIIGSLLPLAIVDLAGGDPDNDFRPYVGGAMAGSILGIGAGHFLIKGKDFSTSDGSFVVLGGVAGGLLGTGIAYLIGGDRGDNSSLYFSSTAIGGIGGYGLMYGLLSKRARKTETGSLWHFEVAPTGIAAAALHGKLNLPENYSTPLLRVWGRF